nr:DNA cytosine methyltransferase [Borrelia sp. BU AG58]
MDQLKFIDLFAGIGGIRIGFEYIGASCVFSSEIDSFAVKTYYENFKDYPVGDIRKINPLHIPNHDILCAGFPCQPFSTAGLRLGFNDIRGTLFYTILDIVKVKMPKVVFLENVKGLVFHDKGITFTTMINHLQDLNYLVFWKVLNAKHFGLPQNRERVFIVAFKEYVNFEFLLPLNINTRVGSILEKDVDDKYTISDTCWLGYKRRKERYLKKGSGFGYKLFNSDSSHTNTLTASGTSEILIEQKGKNPRKLTPRECARLQGFPNSFKIVVSDSQAYKQFGNSVPVSVVKCIAKNIGKSLNIASNAAPALCETA